MSESRRKIKDTFKNIQDLSGGDRAYYSLHNYIRDILQHLDELAKETTDEAELEKIRVARMGLSGTWNGDDLAMVKITQDEATSRKATGAKKQKYLKAVDDVIYFIKSDISSFLN